MYTDKDWKFMENINTSDVREVVLWIYKIIPSITVIYYIDKESQLGREKKCHGTTW